MVAERLAEFRCSHLSVWKTLHGGTFCLTSTTAAPGRSILGFSANDRPNVVGNPALGNRSPERWFNTECFRFRTSGSFGNAGRNILDGPGYQNANVSLLKNTSLREDINLQLRAEFFNLLNHPNFNLPDNFLGSPTFGRDYFGARSEGMFSLV